MMQRFRFLAVLLSLALFLMACALTQKISSQFASPAGVTNASSKNDLPTETVSPNSPANPAGTLEPVNGNSNQAGKKPPQSQAAGIQPSSMRVKLTHLTNLMGYQVLDGNGTKLGVASDYIVNVCEGYVIYIVMDPVAGLHVASGNRVVIPFEVVTINSGVLDAQNKTIQLHLTPDQFSGVPAFPVRQPVTPTDWEGGVRGFWSKTARIGKLATSCNVSGGPVYMDAYASQILGVSLYDGQNNLLGTVQDLILEPESGNIGFYIVKPAKGDGLVMIHLGAINIPKESLLPGGTLKLRLLTDAQLFWNAPRIANIDGVDELAFQSKMRQYWGR